jgi:hypothetical protein
MVEKSDGLLRHAATRNDKRKTARAKTRGLLRREKFRFAATRLDSSRRGAARRGIRR